MQLFRTTTILLFLAIISFSAKAQIGYQVSLLNNATGEPRANESVNVTVKITDSAGNVICEQTKHETTNDFGILSMSVGNADTFADADWSKLPFFIEATIDGRLIGRSQLLSVPIAEHAKHTGSLTKEILCSKTWKHTEYSSDGTTSSSILNFNSNGTGRYSYKGEKGNDSISFHYNIDGNCIAIVYSSNEAGIGIYFPGGGLVMQGPNTGEYLYK